MTGRRPSSLAGPVARGARGRDAGHAGLVAMLLVAAAYGFVRGPVRAWQGTIDLDVFYSASRAWLVGTNPYDDANLNAVFRAAGGTKPLDLSLNPPVTFVLLAPLAALPWGVAERAWTILSVLLAGASIWALAGLVGFRLGQPRTTFFLAFALALAPFHTAISQGQLTVAVTALVVLALWAELHGKGSLAGVAFGLATALKPQMGLLFLLLALVRLRWRVVAAAVATLTALGAVALGRMALAGVAWLPSWRESLATFTRGGTGDPTAANPASLLMINLHVVLHSFVDSRWVVSLLVLAFVFSTGAWALSGRGERGPGPRSELLIYSLAAVLSLLGFYNRFYSATLLILPLAWSVVSLGELTTRRTASVVALGIAPFLVPATAVMNTLARSGALGDLQGRTWWRALGFHEVLALLVLAAALALECRRQGRAAGGA